jgi:hypothetical protein
VTPDLLPGVMEKHLQQLNTSKDAKASFDEAVKDNAAARAECQTLVGFIRKAWPHIPELSDKPYVHGWHIVEEISGNTLIG